VTRAYRNYPPWACNGLGRRPRARRCRFAEHGTAALAAATSGVAANNARKLNWSGSSRPSAQLPLIAGRHERDGEHEDQADWRHPHRRTRPAQPMTLKATPYRIHKTTPPVSVPIAAPIKTGTASKHNAFGPVTPYFVASDAAAIRAVAINMLRSDQRIAAL
jgi:hypothetical protein